MLFLGPEICSNFEAAQHREWLETNGLGGFAASSICNLNTRRYHGLLVAAVRPPTERAVLLAKLEPTLIVNGRRFDLSTNQVRNQTTSTGYHYLRSFQCDPFPTFAWGAGGVLLEQAIWMVHGANTTVITFQVKMLNEPDLEIELELRPLLVFRDYHSTRRQNDAFEPTVIEQPRQLTFRPYPEYPALHLAHNADAVDHQQAWLRDLTYQVEQERGFTDHDDLFQPCVLRFALNKERRVQLIASTEPQTLASIDHWRPLEMIHRARLRRAYTDEFTQLLSIAADQFIVQRQTTPDQPPGHTVIAGYPWFTDWGRDTMIALPGLTLATGRYDIARSILLEFAKHVSQGMLPNRFPDKNQPPEYNTADATLWFFEAIRDLATRTHDFDFVRQHLYDLLNEMIDWHVHGTRYGIKLDRDELLLAGEPGVQLTWMDAKYEDWVVTPRHGKPVEIQALWFNAITIMGRFATLFGDHERAKLYQRMAIRTRRSFRRQFWNVRERCLYDCLGPTGPDSYIRPNQLLAVSLHHTMLTRAECRSIVELVRDELLTPYGLRSLSPRHPEYAGRYVGTHKERDGVYHQGTVWPWLIGPFINAYLRAYGRTRETRRAARAMLDGFEAHLLDAGIGTISEIFDGDPPHAPRGCFAQAWSVSEVLRLLIDEKLTK